MRATPRIIGTLLLLALPGLAMAAEPSFSDVTPGSPVFAAAEYLKAQGILQGYEDGTFRPEAQVNRAEVAKILVEISGIATETGTVQSSFIDVAPDAWYAPFTEAAYKTMRIIDGPPKTHSFAPQRTVTRAEFLKMLLLSYDVDPTTSFGEITFPIASDVNGPDEWYYPYMRYALTASMIAPQKGILKPGEALTRGDVADMLYRFMLYREGKRTQTLLSVTENEVLNALRFIESGALDDAQRSAARAMLAARGALANQQNDNAVKSAVKTSEGAMALVNAARAATIPDMQKTIEQASTAWHLGEKAKSFSSAFDALVKQLQDAATAAADSARLKK